MRPIHEYPLTDKSCIVWNTGNAGFPFQVHHSVFAEYFLRRFEIQALLGHSWWIGARTANLLLAPVDPSAKRAETPAGYLLETIHVAIH